MRRRTAVAVTLLGLVAFGAPARAASGPTLRAIAVYESFHAVPRAQPAGVRVLYRFESIPALTVTGPRAAIEGLEASRIEWDGPISYEMDSALFATNAVDVWGDAWWPFPEDVDRRDPIVVDGRVIDGRGVVVGVVDSGINGLHPDLWYEPAFTSEMPWEPKLLACVNVPTPVVEASQPDCDQTVGHGTHVAGIVAGNGWAHRNTYGDIYPNQRPPMGAAPGAKLVGAALGAGRFIVNAAQGLDWMYDNAQRYGIRVVTNSWGDEPACPNAFPDDTITRISTQLVQDKGITVLFAAGNYGGGPTWTNTYPRNPTPGVVSVANYNDLNAGRRDARISRGTSDGCVASGGAGDYVWTWPDVSAPGVSVLSTAAYTGTLIPAVGRVPFYAYASGTSMATPHVAGIVALMLQANPALTPAQVERILVETATPWLDDVDSRGVVGSAPYWGSANASSLSFVDRSQCRITPAHAADPVATAAQFPRFDQLPDPERFVCRDYRRGAGLVDAHAAVLRAVELQ